MSTFKESYQPSSFLWYPAPTNWFLLPLSTRENIYSIYYIIYYIIYCYIILYRHTLLLRSARILLQLADSYCHCLKVKYILSIKYIHCPHLKSVHPETVKLLPPPHWYSYCHCLQGKYMTYNIYSQYKIYITILY